MGGDFTFFIINNLLDIIMPFLSCRECAYNYLMTLDMHACSSHLFTHAHVDIIWIICIAQMAISSL